MPIVTIIVPVYNDAVHLPKCVASILAQTFSDWELLLIDDGSQDESPALCDRFASQDTRIRALYQKNAGVSAARNLGLAEAEGSYLSFVDSDDWIEPAMLEDLLTEAEKSGADIVMCDAVTVYSDGRTEPDTITQLPENRVIGRADWSPALLREMAGAVWRCLYRTELVRRHNIRFPVGVKFSEDRIFNLYAMGHADRLSYLKTAYYDRFVNTESAVHRFHADYFEACRLAHRATQEALNAAWNGDEAYRSAYASQLIGGALSAVCNYYYKTSTLSPKERRQAVRRVCEDAELRSALEMCGAQRLRERWLLRKNLPALIWSAKLANRKHGR